jgi:hypothetical protein
MRQYRNDRRHLREVKMKPGGILPITQQADRKKVRVGLALRR